MVCEIRGAYLRYVKYVVFSEVSGVKHIDELCFVRVVRHVAIQCIFNMWGVDENEAKHQV